MRTIERENDDDDDEKRVCEKHFQFIFMFGWVREEKTHFVDVVKKMKRGGVGGGWYKKDREK